MLICWRWRRRGEEKLWWARSEQKLSRNSMIQTESSRVFRNRRWSLWRGNCRHSMCWCLRSPVEMDEMKCLKNHILIHWFTIFLPGGILSLYFARMCRSEWLTMAKDKMPRIVKQLSANESRMLISTDDDMMMSGGNFGRDWRAQRSVNQLERDSKVFSTRRKNYHRWMDFSYLVIYFFLVKYQQYRT